MIRYFFFFLFIGVFFSACSGDFFDQTIDIDPPKYDPSLVVNGFTGNQDSIFRMEVTRTFGLLDGVEDSAFYIKNAQVKLFKNGQLLLTAPYGNLVAGWYEAPIPPGTLTAGASFDLEVSCPNFPTARAQQTMPQAFVLDSVRLREKAGISTDGTELFGIDAFIKDKAGEKNYYALAVWEEFVLVDPVFDDFGNVIRLDTVERIYQKVNAEDSDDPNAEIALGQVLVSDQFFDGQAYKLSLKSSYFNSSSYFVVSVRSITEDYYLYFISEERKESSEDLPLAEPVTVHSNISPGIGTFGMFSEKKAYIGH
ncbi:MAG: DUF4249 family protein [Bacteroidetes bacterium]|nr:DUF4249 family protein [Bacteroidota bacterium]